MFIYKLDKYAYHNSKNLKTKKYESGWEKNNLDNRKYLSFIVQLVWLLMLDLKGLFYKFLGCIIISLQVIL